MMLRDYVQTFEFEWLAQKARDRGARAFYVVDLSNGAPTLTVRFDCTRCTFSGCSRYFNGRACGVREDYSAHLQGSKLFVVLGVA